MVIQPPSAPSPEEMAEGAKAVPSKIPPKYQAPESSGLKATVNQGENTADFVLE